MSVGRLTRFMLVATVAALGLAAAPATGASAAPAAQTAAAVAPRTVYYNADAAGVWKPNVLKAVEIWNASVKNVKLVKGSPAAVTLSATDGWPNAQVRELGRGRIELGEEAVRLGHDRTRITAHEFGHILGLPDRRTGLCSDLMSGSSAPATCTNATPTVKEAGKVDSNFGGGFAGASAVLTVLATPVERDCWIESAAA